MTVIPAGRYLAEFGLLGAFDQPGAAEAPRLHSLDPKVAEEQSRKLEEAHNRGKLEGRAAAFEECERRMAENRRQLDGRLAADRQAWAMEEGARLGQAIEAAFARLEADLASSVAGILKPLMASALREQVVAELALTLSTLVDDGHAALKVSGPADLVEALRPHVDERRAIEHVAGDDVDLRIVADQTVVETRLRSWIDRFDAAAG